MSLNTGRAPDGRPVGTQLAPALGNGREDCYGECVNAEQESLSARVRRLRTIKGLSQEGMARRVGVSKTQVHLVESGKTGKPQAETLRNYARVLGVSVAYLNGERDAPSNEGARVDPWPPLEIYLRHTSVLSDEEIAQVARIVRALELDQQRELAIKECDGGRGLR